MGVLSAGWGLGLFILNEKMKRLKIKRLYSIADDRQGCNKRPPQPQG